MLLNVEYEITVLDNNKLFSEYEIWSERLQEPFFQISYLFDTIEKWKIFYRGQ